MLVHLEEKRGLTWNAVPIIGIAERGDVGRGVHTEPLIHSAAQGILNCFIILKSCNAIMVKQHNWVCGKTCFVAVERRIQFYFSYNL